MRDIFTILEKEINNTSRIMLYKDDGVWRAYEHSAYLLSVVLPSVCSTKNINNYYEIIIASNAICCDECMNALLQHEVITKEADYMEFDLTGLQISTEKFDEWKENIPY